jgi:hypothetical protein
VVVEQAEILLQEQTERLTQVVAVAVAVEAMLAVEQAAQA